jgi:hypothetical protein
LEKVAEEIMHNDFLQNQYYGYLSKIDNISMGLHPDYIVSDLVF